MILMLTDKQKERYARQISLEEIGLEGQKKLLNAKILIIGAGGLGSPAAMYLAAAGAGTIGIADSDSVDLSNLQRQILHSVKDIERPKVISASESMRALNPDVTVIPYHVFLNDNNIRQIIRDFDFVLDCTDNFSSKFIINDACVLEGKPFVHAGIMNFSGQLMTYVPGQGPCYRCIFKEPPKVEMAAPGVIGAVAGTIGCLQALEAIKYITGAGQLLTGCLLTFDGLKMEFRKLKLPKSESCPVCGNIAGE